MRDALCKAFCADLSVTKVPVGYAVSHSSWEFGDDPICIYIVGPDADGLWTIQDDGATVPYIEASGADLDIPARARAFQAILDDYAASYDDANCELKSYPVPEAAIPAIALRFFSAIVRVQGLALMSRERAQQTWTEELERDLEKALAGKAAITRGVPLTPDLADYPPDLVVRADERAPVAVYFGLSDAKAYEALLLRTQAKYHFSLDSPVVLVLENDNSISRKQRLRADANLIVPRYRGAERDTIGRIVEEATGSRPGTGMIH
jgi:hypothetical protein